MILFTAVYQKCCFVDSISKTFEHFILICCYNTALKNKFQLVKRKNQLFIHGNSLKVNKETPYSFP